MELRISRFGAIYNHSGALVWDNAIKQVQHPLSLSHVLALHMFREPAEFNAAESDPELPLKVHSAISELMDWGVLIIVGGTSDETEQSLMGEWRSWSTAARLYHFSTRVTTKDRVTSPSDAQRELQARTVSDPPPARFRETSHETDVNLTATSATSWAEQQLGEVMGCRRMVRQFSDEPISRQNVAQMLSAAAGTSQRRGRNLTDRRNGNFFRSSPSGGARASTEVYVLARAIDGVDPGIYRYNPVAGGLSPIGGPLTNEVVEEMACGQHWFADCPAILIYTMFLPSLTWKYKHARTYRAGYLDAGHLSQSLLMVATALGLSATFTAMCRDDLIEEALGLSPGREPVIGLCGLGYAKHQDPVQAALHTEALLI